MRLPAPERGQDGLWYVAEKHFETNAKAWRYIDRMENEPVSRAEDLGDWVASKILNKE